MVVARPKIFREFLLPIGALLAVVGLAATVLAFTYDGDGAGWNGWYENLVGRATGGDWNLAIKVVAPVVLFTGGWYFGEQILGRVRVRRLLGSDKKSDFLRMFHDVERSLPLLPRRFRTQVEARRDELKGR